MSRQIVVAGAGPGVGAAVAHRFGRDGYDVGLLARSADRLESLATELRETGATADWAPVDLTVRDDVAGAVARFGERTGRIDVLHFNPSAFTQADPLELTADQLLHDLELGVASMLTVVQAARPFLQAGARVLATGSRSADRPWAAAASLGVQKAGLRNLVAAVDSTLKNEGIRAATLTVNGTISEGSAFDPAHIADALYALAQTSSNDWRTTIPFDG
ncbi:MAG TPA: SDR family oxidoreductase [Jiangellaceae bacterium]|nr:SDR family oxidoreductase [Jiangellaceae bacterium]